MYRHIFIRFRLCWFMVFLLWRMWRNHSSLKVNTCAYEGNALRRSFINYLHCQREERFWPGGMNESANYPPPDFGSPPSNSFQSFQQQRSHSSSFHPTMWSWSETPTEHTWGCDSSVGRHHGLAASYGFSSNRGNHGPTHTYSEWNIQ